MSQKEKIQRHEAVALGYNPNEGQSPKVLAKGKGLVAEKILEKAKENKVPIQEDPSLVELLSNLNINENIPEELYQAVAEVFAFVYRLDQQIEKRDQVR
ncbi:EscU/YscU/HrcU family type III secretion system export apparatus switch protein [Cytobacillus spongiae]|jgi:flagellar biosynthesis protein|uniref:EscU/YscU/HrcU family type III secretion system export apparatus switch protein n=1 Tax=Cytobacillus spongiae TaxID=2901381 RepID=UPI001F3E27A6|nr:EscU/YscU/HrcU family type III secretion system export apparatus switch protein [Cytobacillus spongiae]UII57397.1 EscU/YscU/HrcU family type III secretion system export apparatus switch protein [Cytobacillus spongiae]